jgi:hypothetical protein
MECSRTWHLTEMPALLEAGDGECYLKNPSSIIEDYTSSGGSAAVELQNCLCLMSDRPRLHFYNLKQTITKSKQTITKSNVPDPDPNPDLRVFGLPDPDPIVRGMDPDPPLNPDPSTSCKNNKKNLESFYFVTLFDF